MKAPFNLRLSALALLTLGGCSQILGLGDYEVDPSLDPQGNAGESSGGTSAGKGGKSGVGGEGTAAGEAGQGGRAGESAQAGQGGQGGAGGQGGEPGGGAGGQGGAGEPPHGDEILPCDSADCCTESDGVAVGEELLIDGGFELGPVADELTPWTEQSTGEYPAIVNEDDYPWAAKGGTYYGYLGGSQDETTNLWSEDVVIPSDAGWIELSGYRLFEVDEQSSTNSDYAVVDFYGYDADPYEEPFYWTDPEVVGSNGWGNATTWTAFSASWSAAPHQGGVRYLSIEGYADAYPDSEFSVYLFDSLSLKAYRCYRKE